MGQGRKGGHVTLHLNVKCVVYLDVLVIAEHLDNILFCHNSNIIFEYDSLAIFAGTAQKYSCPPPPCRISYLNKKYCKL